MRIIALFAFIACASLFGETRKDILVLVRNDSADYTFFIEKEVAPMLAELDTRGLAYDVATVDGKPIKTVSGRETPTLIMDSGTMTRYKGLVVPCMGADDFPVPKGMQKIVADAYGRKTPIASQHSPEVFTAAKIRLLKAAERPGIVVDGRVITSYNCPMTARSSGTPIDTVPLIDAPAEMIK
jgi:hypothetical protein